MKQVWQWEPLLPGPQSRGIRGISDAQPPRQAKERRDDLTERAAPLHLGVALAPGTPSKAGVSRDVPKDDTGTMEVGLSVGAGVLRFVL